MYIRIVTILGWIIFAAPVPAQVVVFEENFDGPDAPAGWLLEDGWTLSTMTPSSGSGVTSLQHKGNAASSATTPIISLSGASSATLTYLIRRTGSYAPDNLVVTASADGGATYPFTLLGVDAAVPTGDSSWELITAVIPNELLGLTEVVIRFEGQGLYTAGATSRIDDVTLSAAVPLEVAPRLLSFVAPVGESRTESFTATNRTSGAITVEAPAISGMGFSIVPSGVVALAPGGIQRYDVTFMAASQGSVHGSVLVEYGFGSAEIALNGSGSGGVLGFGAPSSSTLEEESGVAVPLELSFSAPTGLQGLQFRIRWTGGALSVAGVDRGADVAGAGSWALSHEAGLDYVDVVLLGDGGASLPGGTYDALVSLLFDVGTIPAAAEAHLMVESVIGALAEPSGTDADLAPAAGAHVITIEPRVVSFSASTSFVDLGHTAVGGSVAATVAVANPGGNTDLVISTIDVPNALFTITPDSARIAPDASEEFTITFVPTSTSFGRQHAEATFVHNGEATADVISLTGVGRGGRGDADGDGIVDALDIVHAIDFVLDRLTPNGAQKAAADLFPFPDGDDELDVRDLTVLSQALVRGLWPDDVSLPVEAPSAETAEPSGIRLAVDPDMIEMAHDTPIRAFQIVLPATAAARVDVGSSTIGVGSSSVQTGEDADRGNTIAYGVRATTSSATGTFRNGSPSEHELRVLVYRPDGGLIAPGAMHLVTSGVIGRPSYVTVIGEGRHRLRIDDSVWTSTEDALPSTVLPGKPYPNPFRAGGEVLRIPVGANSLDVIVYDLLGRIVQRFSTSGSDLEWDGMDTSGRLVGSGVYLVRIEGGHDSQTHAVQIVR